MQPKINFNRIGLYLGPLLFLLILLLPVPEGMEPEAWKTTAVAVLMAFWWISEAIPIPAASLLPIILFPILGIAPIGVATAPYANSIIFLFMGGFIIAIAMQKSNLHKRIALRIISFVGVKPLSIIMGFIIASAFLSMWVSNTATALMMLPIALSVLSIAPEHIQQQSAFKKFSIALILSIAYACSIGGMGTLIGTPPNSLFAAYIQETYGLEISFAGWMVVSVPIVVLFLILMFLILTRLVYKVDLKELPGGKALIEQHLREIGKISKPEVRVAIVFVLTALLWIFRPLVARILPGLSDAGIAIGAGLALFILPSGKNTGDRLLNWGNLKELPWGILILFGGGLSLAMAINDTKLAVYIGEALRGLNNLHMILVIFIVVLIIIFLTEITSNTATASAFLPIVASMAITMGQHPILFAFPAVLAASCAFMLPVATPPNAIVYSSGKISIPQMAKVGFWLNIVFSMVLTVAAYFLFTGTFGLEIFGQQ